MLVMYSDFVGHNFYTMNPDQSRFQFIAHALNGDGPFRPFVVEGIGGKPAVQGGSYLVRYPRESDTKFARRNEVAWYASVLADACHQFVSYFGTRAPVRDFPHPIYKAMAADVDGRGNAVDVFWQQFMVDAKARGSMCLLVDMPPAVDVGSMASQLQQRVAPFVTAIKPEQITDYEIGDDGKFVFAKFGGSYTMPGGEMVACVWHFDRVGWQALSANGGDILDAGEHGLGECPLLIFTESGAFPYFGSFAQLADISKRLFNLESELDEILRSQTFSLMTMQVPENSTTQQKIEASNAVAQTIGTNNLMVHTGAQPGFIAPPDGPARVYLDRISKLEARAREIGLDVSGSQAQETGVALQMRFQRLNGALSTFSSRMQDFELRMWDLVARWLRMATAPIVTWPRDFNLADVATELEVLERMQATAMPVPVLVQQEKRIVGMQFAGLGQEELDVIHAAIDERVMEPLAAALPTDADNVVALRPQPEPDPDADVRAALVQYLKA